MICALRWNDKLYYIDATVKTLSFGEIPEWIQGQKVLIEDDDKFILTQIPNYALDSNKDNLFARYSIDNGQLIGEEQRSFSGESKHNILYWLNSVQKSEQDQLIEAFVKADETQDSISEIKTHGLNEFLPVVRVDYNVKRTSNINTFGDQIYSSLDVCKDYQNAKIDIENRKRDLKFAYKNYIERLAELILPDNYELVRLPQEVEIVRDCYSFTSSYKKEGNKIIYRKLISFSNQVLEKKDFVQWNSDVESFRRAYSELIVLKKQP